MIAKKSIGLEGRQTGKSYFQRFISNKKGISPLIATVLLIAFAVALGSVVYTYFILLVDSGEGTTATGCARFAALDASKDNIGDYIYLFESPNSIRANLFNKGYSEIHALTYVVEGSNSNLVVESMPFSLSPGISRQLSIDYNTATYGSVQRIIITPHFIRNAQSQLCIEGRIEITKQRR